MRKPIKSAKRPVIKVVTMKDIVFRIKLHQETLLRRFEHKRVEMRWPRE